MTKYQSPHHNFKVHHMINNIIIKST